MSIKPAAVRALRTGLQAFVAASALGAVATFRDLADVKKAGVSFALAFAFGVASGIVAFAQNLAEDNTSISVPK